MAGLAGMDVPEAAVLRAGGSKVAQIVALTTQGSVLPGLVYHASSLTLLGVAGLFFNGVSGFYSPGSLSFSIAEVKQQLQQVLARLEVLLREPALSGERHLIRAINYLERPGAGRGRPHEAYDSFKLSAKMAVKAQEFAKNDSGLLCAATQLLLFCDIYIETFNSETGEFTPLEELSPSQRAGVYSVVRADINEMLVAASTVEKKSWYQKMETFEAECRAEVGLVLRQALPFLLRFHPSGEEREEGEVVGEEGEEGPAEGRLVLEPLMIPEDMEDCVTHSLGMRSALFPALSPSPSCSRLSFPPTALPSTPDPSDSVLIWRDGFEVRLAIGPKVYLARCLAESGQLIVRHRPSAGLLQEGRLLPSRPLADLLSQPVLEGAIKRGNTPAFLLLLPHLAAPDLLRLATLAGRHGAAACLEAILALEGATKLDLTTPLRAASINGRNAALETVVRWRGKAVLTAGFDSCSPLELAAAAGHLDTVRLLVRLGSWATLERAGRGERARLDRLMPLEVTVLAGEMVNPGTQRKEVNDYLRLWREEHTVRAECVLGDRPILGTRYRRMSLDAVSLDRMSLDRVSLDRVSLDRVSLDRVSHGRVSLDLGTRLRHLSLGCWPKGRTNSADECTRL